MTKNIDLEELQSISPITPQLIDAMESQESSGDPFSISSAGAEGPMQFTPDTAKRFGVKDVYNREEAKAGAMRAMNYYYGKYGDLDKALAAYNAGEGRVDKGGEFPPETRKYIPSVKARLEKLQGKGKKSRDLEELESFYPPSFSTVAKTVLKSRGQAISEAERRLEGRDTGEPILPYVFDRLKRGFEPMRMLDQETLGNNKILEMEKEGKISHEEAMEQIGRNHKLYGEPLIGKPEGIPVPKTSTGRRSLAAMYAGAFAEYAALSIIPSGAAVKAGAKPLMAAITEIAMTASAAMSGTHGRLAGEQLGPKYGLTPEEGGDIGEMVLSTLVPALTKSAAYGIGKGIGKGLEKGKEALGISGFGKEDITEAARLATQKEIQAGYTGYPPAAKNVAEAERLRGLEPTFQPSVARATGSPAVIAMEQGEATKSVEMLTKSATEREALLGATKRYGEKVFPSPTRPYTRTVENRLATTQKSLQSTQAEIDSQLKSLGQRTSRFNQTEIGQNLRSLRNEEALKVKKVVDSKYDYSYAIAAAHNFQPNMGPVVKEIEAALGDEAKIWQKKPGVLGEILSKYLPKIPPLKPARTVQAIRENELITRKAVEYGTPVSFKEFDSLYKRLNQELGEAFALGKRTGDWGNYNALDIAKKALKSRLDQIEGSPTLVGKAYSEANKFYATQFAPRFEKGVGGEMAKINRYGYITPDHKVFNALINNPTGLKEAFGLYGNNPRFLGALKRGLYDDFSAHVMKDGVFSPSAAKTYLSAHKDTLALVPEIGRELKNNTVMAEKLLLRRQNIVAEVRGFDKQNLSKLLGAENPTQYIAGKMDDPRALMGMVNVVKNNPSASQSFAHELAGIIVGRNDSAKFLAEHEEALKPIFNSLGEKHWQNIKDLVKMEEIAERVRVPSYVGEKKAEDIGTTLFGTSLPGLVAAAAPRTFATSIRNRVINLTARFGIKIREEQLQQFREAALFNPDVSSVLAQIAKHGSTPKLENSLKTHLFAHGVKVIGITGENMKETREGEKR